MRYIRIVIRSQRRCEFSLFEPDLQSWLSLEAAGTRSGSMNRNPMAIPNSALLSEGADRLLRRCEEQGVAMDEG